jgi:hypothetical protein
MNKEDFIKKLQRERTDYKYASQVRTIAKSLIQLSVGIYTEPERFVYELLQNAVDAFSDTNNDTLEILIRAEKDRFVFMHNGKPFSEKDVEGICDVGNGTKAKDSKKIGYKGIGFKSVFMPSVSRVSIVSNQFCFEFDKYKAHALMPKFPYEDGILNPDDIPWQVIPIDAFYLKPTYDPNFNVITTIYTQEADKIGVHVENLFSDLQFLLFLSSNNVNIRFERNGQFVLSVGKKQSVGVKNMPEVMLYKNDQAQSSWMLYTKEVSVPPEVKIALENDFNTPDKLKGAEQLQISFAVQTKGNEVVALRNTPVFTFLPTSYRALRQPFLINSNFITDAGRQQLHQESEWNKLIFREIPVLYLDFVSKFSTQFANYTDVLPTLYPDSDTLVRVYRSELDRAFDTIAFVPNREGNRLLKLREVLVDKTGISKGIIPTHKFLDYFNKKNKTFLKQNSFVENEGIVEYASNQINLFGTEELLMLITDKSITNGISISDDIKLIRFLYNYFQNPANRSDSYKKILANASILYDEEENLCRTQELFFPSDFKGQNDEANNVAILNELIYENIKEDSSIIDWLSSIGMRDLSNMSFVEYLFSNHDYITKENAISIGRFLFNVWKEENFLEKGSNAEEIRNLCFLSKDGQLRPISNLYLGSLYRPDDDMESVCENNSLYISDEYPDGSIEDWAFFLKKCGAMYKIGLAEKDFTADELGFNYIQKTAEVFKDCPHRYTNYYRYKNPIIDIHFKVFYFTFVDYNNPNYKLDRLIFSKVLSMDRSNWGVVDKVYGKISYWGDRVERDLNDFAPYEFKSQYNSFLEYIIGNEQKFPTTRGTSERPDNVFINNPITIELGGKYLPILDISSKIHESWRAVLPFKQNLTTNDLLDILEGISKDSSQEKSLKKERISKIYRELIERGEQCSDSIREWSKSHSILSQSGEFLPASDLTYITVDGFKNDGNKVYCEKVGKENRESLLQLLKTFGVQVITQKEISTNFDNAYEDEELKKLLMDKLQYLVVLQDKGKSSFVEKKFDLENKIKNTHFYKCDSISLTYGQDNDTISKSTFSEGNNFYYTGKITPVLIEPLLSPLCSHLNIGNSNDSKLMVILITNDHQSLVDYLTDCGYKVDNLSEPQLPQILEENEIVSGSGEKIVTKPGLVSTIGQMEINKEVRIHVKPFLAAHGYDVSSWNPENSLPDLVGVIKDPNGNPINVVIRSAKQHNIHLSASSFETLMANPNNLLIVENHQGIHTVSFEELFSNNSNVTLIFDAKYTPREYFRALGVIFKYVKNTEFIVRDPHFSVYDEIKGFGLEMKNDGTVLIGSTEDI